MLRVLFFSLVRDLTGEKETTAEVVPTVRALLENLSVRYGERFRQEIFPGGEVSGEHIVMVNGRHIAHSGGAETPLKGGDVVTIFPMIGGG